MGKLTNIPKYFFIVSLDQMTEVVSLRPHTALKGLVKIESIQCRAERVGCGWRNELWSRLSLNLYMDVALPTTMVVVVGHGCGHVINK